MSDCMKFGLYAFKHKQVLTNHGYEKTSTPPFFGPFNVWVLERRTPASSSSIASLHNDTRTLDRDKLRSFLIRKKWVDLALKKSGRQGRLRLIFSTKANEKSPTVAMHLPDFEIVERELKLHPSTPLYLQRTMKSSRFWGRSQPSFSILLAFPPYPLMRFSHISLSYDIGLKCTNALIIELGNVKKGLQANDFVQMLDTCQEALEHPLLVPTLLLDMLMSALEAKILKNIASVEELEDSVSSLPPIKEDNKPLAQRGNVTKMLSDLHKTLKKAIKLLDAANWMEKTATMLTEIGNQLNHETDKFSLVTQWDEIQGFLEDLKKLTTHLQPDPTMTIQRCLSQIDILNNKIAQEDNLLAARMAVSATRDSSAMKALAVITAVFLPGTYIATLFSMSMFNWQGGGDSSASGSGTSSHSAVVMSYIWIYWVISFVLTFVVMVGWRVWWVAQDRKFRIELPTVQETSSDGKVDTTPVNKNALPKTFVEDLLGLRLQSHRKHDLPS